MNTSILNFTIISSPKTKFSDAQILLREFTGKQFPRNEAQSVWANITNHKWNMSERLGRDVGFRVAAIDFIENFYQTNQGVQHTQNLSPMRMSIPAVLRKAFRSYIEAKGAFINY